VAGVRVLVARDDGAGSYVDGEYTLNGSHGSTLTAVTINEVIKADTPVSGYIRVGGVPYTYSAFDSGTKVFTLTGQLGSVYAGGTACFVPFLDLTADATEEISANFTFSSNFNARLIARKGTSPSYKPFTAAFAVTSAGGSMNAILDSDE